MAPLLLTAVIAVTTVFLLMSLWALQRTGVPVVRSSDQTVQAAMELLRLEDGEHFCDLGCGFGAVLVASRREADVSALGLELNPAVAICAALRTLGDKNVRVRALDSRTADFGSPDAVFMFLMPHALIAMKAPLERRLAKGARVISVDFPIDGWVPSAERHCRDGHGVFLYEMGSHESPRPQ